MVGGRADIIVATVAMNGMHDEATSDPPTARGRGRMTDCPPTTEGPSPYFLSPAPPEEAAALAAAAFFFSLSAAAFSSLTRLSFMASVSLPW